MRDAWDPKVAPPASDPVAECVYCTRLIGSDPSLVLHGGGNSSVLTTTRDITGKDVPTLRVKGSGWDMASIEAPGLTALRLERLHELLALPSLSDPDMMRELAAAKLDPSAPNPSVESLLHAFLPHPAVQHSHADCIVNLTNLADGEETVRRVFGDRVVVIPYVMPGFDLARAVRDAWPTESHSGTEGMVLLKHGLFTFGEDHLTAYRRHLDLIRTAEAWLDEHAPREEAPETAIPAGVSLELAQLRAEISAVAGAPVVVERHADADSLRFARRDDLADLAERGPLTPDHVIRTKRRPLVGRDVRAYASAYRTEVAEHAHRARTELVEIDPAPRIALDPVFGLLGIGRTPAAAGVASDIYRHTIPVLERSQDHLGGTVPLSPAELFDMEYWDLEQAKLARSGPPPALAGTVALVTGAASGIGAACADEFLRKGAAVVGLDIDPSVTDRVDSVSWLGLTVDVTQEGAQAEALEAAADRFGGIDHLVVSAGRFDGSVRLSDLTQDRWRPTQAVNVDAVAELFHLAQPLLACSPVGGRVVVIGSKNVPAPGMGAAAYSASKAAVTQLARVAAHEWAADGVRVNVVHPDAVFDTGLWSDELVSERAAASGLTAEEYRRRNLLGVEITSAQVAASVVALCSDEFAATTGAQIPIDGGNDRVL